MTDFLFKKFYKILSVVAVMSVIVPIVYVFLYRFIPNGYWPLLYIVSALLFCVGYGMQAVYGAIISSRHNVREGYDDDSGYESNVNPFKPLFAALPIIVAALIGSAFYGIVDRLLYKLYVEGGLIYDSQSLYPYFGAIAAFALVTAGIVIWFYPPHRIISMRSMFAYFGVMGVTFAASLMMSVPTTLLSISLIVFFACSFIVLNQTHIRRGVTGTMTAISDDGKFYNLKLMIVASVVVVLVLIVFFAVFTGVGFVLKFVFTYIALKILNGKAENDDYVDEDQMYSDFSGAMFENQPVGQQFFIILFIIMFIGAIVFFIFRGSDAVRRLIEKIKDWIREIFLFFMSEKEYRGMGQSMSREYANYTDETISLQDAAIRAYDPKIVEKRSYREFIAYLNSLPTATDQIRYAYVTMLSVFRSLGYGIRPSETPRETKVRVKSRSATNDLEIITSALESVDYIEVEPSEEKCDAAVNEMCRIIRGNFRE